MSGRLYGVGVGPGDPELLTLKAVRMIESADVIAYPAPDDGESFARAIAARYIRQGVDEVPIVIPMRAARHPAQAVYDAAADAIAAHLSGGRDVVVLCEGDPFFYGSFMYLFARLQADFTIEVVPGVTSLTTCAAVAGAPLAARNDVVTIAPGTLSDDALRRQILASDTTAVIKVGRRLTRIRTLIGDMGLMDRASYVSHASLPHQVVTPLVEAPEDAPYFSMILVRRGADPWLN